MRTLARRYALVARQPRAGTRVPEETIYAATSPVSFRATAILGCNATDRSVREDQLY